MTVTNPVGANRGDILPFELGTKVSSDFSDTYDPMKGEVFHLGKGLQAILVEASAIVASPARLCFKWSDTDAYIVAITSATGSGGEACGVAPDDQVALAVGDYFFILRGVGGIVNCIDSGAGITKGDLVQPTAAGEVLTDAAYARNETIGIALETVAADLPLAVMLTEPLAGIDA